MTPHGRAGLIGGLGPESTIDYYRRILERWTSFGARRRAPAGDRQSRCHEKYVGELVELPLLLRDETVAGLTMLDTTALHVEAIVGRLAEA